MEDLISKRKLLNDLAGMYDVLTGAGDPFLACMIKRAMECVERQPIVECSDRRNCDGSQNNGGSGICAAGD